MAKIEQEQRATLRQIADSAHVSVATVSYVLNGKQGVSQKKRREIEQLLEGSGLKPKHLRNPAFYLTNESSFAHLATFSPFIQKYEGLNEGFHDEGISLRMEFVNTENSHLRPQLDELLSYKPGGIILDADLGDAMDPIVGYFSQREIPLVQIGHTVRAQGVDAVVIDDFNGAHAGVRHLISQGHTKIATIRWKVAADPASAKKHAGFLLAMAEGGLAVPPQYVVESPPKRESSHPLPGRMAINQLLTLPDPPTAVFVENTFVSAPLLYPIQASEPELPAAIAKLDMVHFEAWDLAFVEQVMNGMFLYPSRRSKLLQVNWRQMGRVASKRLADLMTRPHSGGEVIRLAPRLVQVAGSDVSPL